MSRTMQLPKSARAGNSRSLMLLLPLCVALVGTLVAAVPASVLAQNTELSTNANNKLQMQQQQQQLKEEEASVMKRGEEAASVTVAPADKKSSPEIVPASFSNAPPAKGNNNNNNGNNPKQQQQAGIYALPSNDEILAAVAAAAAQSNQQQQQLDAEEGDVESNTMRKRGINYDYNPYATNDDFGPYPNAPSYLPSDVPSGVWADDYEPSAALGAQPMNFNERELQDDYVPERRVTVNNNNNNNARNKAYDNLQNLLNAEAYLESIPLSVPLQYANRNYGMEADRNKRGIYYNMGSNAENLNKYRRYGDMRLKRDTTKLTPADMLALVALVEAGERARKDSNVEAAAVPALSQSMGDSYAMPGAYETDDLDYAGNAAGVPAGNWLDAQPALVDYYGMPVNVETVPKYEYVQRQHKYNGNGNRFGSSKRFMVSKKKRSVSTFMNEPVAERGPNYNGEKFY